MKPPRPIKIHVQPRTLPPHTPAQPPTGPTVSAPARASMRKAPPPERSTPRLGGPRFVASAPLEALRAPPAERRTPRLGGPRPPPPSALSAASGSDVGDDTLFINRRKQHLVAQATTDPDKSLYGSLGAKTHHSIQLAADENARRLWSAASTGQRRLARPARAPDTRWIPAALYVGTLVIVVFGFWLWNFKAERNSVLDHMTRGELPAQGARQGAPLEDAAVPTQTPAPDPADVADAPETEEDVPVAPSAAPATSVSSLPPSATASTSAGRAHPSGVPKKAPEQRIFTDAPF